MSGSWSISRCCAAFTALLLCLAPIASDASCRITAAKCVPAGDRLNSGGILFRKAPQAVPPVNIGEILPNDYTMLMNRKRYGLPPVGDNWHYYRVESRVYRVEYPSRKVLEDVTHLVNRAFY